MVCFLRQRSMLNNIWDKSCQRSVGKSESAGKGQICGVRRKLHVLSLARRWIRNVCNGIAQIIGSFKINPLHFLVQKRELNTMILTQYSSHHVCDYFKHYLDNQVLKYTSYVVERYWSELRRRQETVWKPNSKTGYHCNFRLKHDKTTTGAQFYRYRVFYE